MFIVVILWKGVIKFVDIIFLVVNEIIFFWLCIVLVIMFWGFVGIEVFMYLLFEFKNFECDFLCVLIIGLMLVGVIYWVCIVVVLYFGVYSDKIVVIVLLLFIIVYFFGIQVLWIVCIIGYFICFVSLNVYV